MRKKLPTIFITIFLCIFILQMVSIIFLLLTPTESKAIDFKPQITVGDFIAGDPREVSKLSEDGKTMTSDLLGKYIEQIYNYAIGAVGILATVVMMLGGIIWITAGGNQTRIGEAKAWIGASLTGLVLVLASYTILNMINPDLLNFEAISVNVPEKTELGCCEWPDGTATMDMKSDCDPPPLTGQFIGYNHAVSSDGKKCEELGFCEIIGLNANVFRCTKMIKDKCDTEIAWEEKKFHQTEEECLRGTGCCAFNYDNNNGEFELCEDPVSARACEIFSNEAQRNFQPQKKCVNVGNTFDWDFECH